MCYNGCYPSPWDMPFGGSPSGDEAMGTDLWRGMTMKKNMAALTFVLLFMSRAGLCQIDPNPNGYGVYFDEGAMTNTITAEAGETVQAYLMITNGPVTEPANMWYCPQITVGSPDQDDIEFTATPRGGGVNQFEADPLFHWIEFHVTYDEPLLTITGNTVLADLEIFVPTTESIRIWAAIGEMSIYFPDGGWQGYSSNYQRYGTMPPYQFYVAGINTENSPVETERYSWGQIKALYQ